MSFNLWSFTIYDLRQLGAKKLYRKFCAGATDHVSKCISTQLWYHGSILCEVITYLKWKRTIYLQDYHESGQNRCLIPCGTTWGYPVGKGPKASCKHIAATCHALQEFFKSRECLTSKHALTGFKHTTSCDVASWIQYHLTIYVCTSKNSCHQRRDHVNLCMRSFCVWPTST